MTKANIPATISCLTIISVFAVIYSSTPAHADCGYSYENDVENDCPLEDKDGKPIWGQLSNGAWVSYESAIESRDWETKNREMRKRMRKEKKERNKKNAERRKIEIAKLTKNVKKIMSELRCVELTKNPNNTTKAEWKRCNDFITYLRSRGVTVSWW